MKIINSDLFHLKGFENPVCCAVLDCTYWELIDLVGKIPRPNIHIKRIKRNKKIKQNKEEIFLIIGVTKPNGVFSEVRTSINMVNPLEAKGSLSIYPPNVDLVPIDSKIELLRYEIISTE